MLPEFYKDKEIFITGGSGIVGTALIEKILRSCNVRKIYLLLRPKRNLTAEERLAKVKEEVIFRQLKKLKPHELDDKLVAISGDARQPFLGITTESAKLLENVSIVFHCAATIRFDEPIKEALLLNVGGTLKALKFAETLKKLKVFMHVSTYFSNPYLKYIKPKVYEAPMDWKFCLDLVQRQDINEEELNIITRKLIVGFPNTYTFTKNLAESLVNEYKDKLPICIYRPSIVFFALDQPEPGFSSSFMGVMGLYAITGAGLLKTIYVGENIRLDMSPQDVTVNNMLYFAFKTCKIYENSKPKKTPVFITSNNAHFDLTLKEYISLMADFNIWEKAAYMKSLFLPGIYYTSSRLIYMFLVFLLHILPALFIDFILILTGRKPVLLKIQRKLFQTLEVLQPFMFNSYDGPGISLFDEMIEDLKGTDFNVEVYKRGKEIFLNAGFGYTMLFSVRELLFKEEPKSLPKAKRIFHFKAWLYNFLKFYILYKLLLRIINYLVNYFTVVPISSICYASV